MHQRLLDRLPVATALRQACFAEPYGRRRLVADLLAGITVGVIAIPLSMALAIASGVPPQHGLYTAVVAGAVIALTGGSRYSVSGPTAAFVVILFPVAQQFGLAGLLTASLIAGAMLLAMGVARMGVLIEFIPEPVTVGFTAGIAIVIAVLQVPDLLGLAIGAPPEDFVHRIAGLVQALPTIRWPTVVIAAATFATMLLWPRIDQRIPPQLVGLVAGTLLALLLDRLGMPVDTIASRFEWTLPDGSSGRGIPPVAPHFAWPWQQPGPDGTPLVFDLRTIQALLAAGFSMAMLGAIESLLCAVVLDGMSGTRHHTNGELIGQGLGNLVAPLFGGITATAAIARSATNFRAGATSPLASLFHALTVLLGLVLLAPLLGWLPMAAMAALLLRVAWVMSESHRVIDLLRRAPRGDIALMLGTATLTVLFDMVVAITFGVLLAALMLVRNLSRLTRISDISTHARLVPVPLPSGWRVVKINGPLFFGSADRVFEELAQLTAQDRGVVLYLDAVHLLDAAGLGALEEYAAQLHRRGAMLILADLHFGVLRTLARAGVRPEPGRLLFTPTLAEAVDRVASGEFEAQPGAGS